uniref:Trypsin-like peptidase domain-containing protein n=1 Tax=Yoonia rhodophyticola TaxID=3137370 RepID=A0AAN0MEV2_9RHOB
MTDHRSISRLEGLATTGALDRVQDALDKAPPILNELGISPDAVKTALGTGFTQLESIGMQPSQLEAIVRAVGRPPMLVKNSKVEGKMSLSGDFDANISGKITAVEPFLGSVGRVEFVNHDMGWGGTGWVIADDGTTMLMVTNRHVAKLVAKRTHRGDGVFLFSPFGATRYAARIDFGEEAGVPPDPARVLQVEKFTYLADDAAADVAIAEIRRPSEGVQIGALPLAASDGDDGETVAVVGYPAADPFRKRPDRDAELFSQPLRRQTVCARVAACAGYAGHSGA